VIFVVLLVSETFYGRLGGWLGRAGERT
jgi:hypothetical protein